MTLLIIGTVRLPAGTLATALPAMTAMVDATRAEDGCIHYSYAEDVLDAGLIHIKELWPDQATLDAHAASAHIATWRSTWKQLGISDRDLSLYTVGEPRKI
ncbi:MAG TPA: putative quinol monooxygenase [Sphingomonas sp.]|jgi:quinol monooxygenase YgiN|nr:putative quinol monooxygenase [Sphingomonas sp.]